MRTRRGLKAVNAALDAENQRLHRERRELVWELRAARANAAAVDRENEALRLALADLGRQLHRAHLGPLGDEPTLRMPRCEPPGDDDADDLLVPAAAAGQ